jgi:hypothetical protein
MKLQFSLFPPPQLLGKQIKSLSGLDTKKKNLKCKNELIRSRG